MGFVTNSDGRACEGIKWHSRQKHAFLEAYLSIWSEQVGKTGKPMPTLDIFDLYASFGLCHCSDKNKTWEGSALLAAECLKKYQNGRLLFLNTFSPSEDETVLQKKSLETPNINSGCTYPIYEIITTQYHHYFHVLPLGDESR